MLSFSTVKLGPGPSNIYTRIYHKRTTDAEIKFVGEKKNQEGH
jgi:hypothetical protein